MYRFKNQKKTSYLERVASSKVLDRSDVTIYIGEEHGTPSMYLFLHNLNGIDKLWMGVTPVSVRVPLIILKIPDT